MKNKQIYCVLLPETLFEMKVVELNLILGMSLAFHFNNVTANSDLGEMFICH